jgi:glycosyltransferase involved in cell wall biosynthesis
MRLYYFTQSYPYGIGERWKANELNVLVNHFDEVIVIPFSYDNNFDKPKPLPKGVKLEGPLFKEEPFSKGDLFNVLFHRRSFAFIKEFFKKKVYKNKIRIASWLAASMRVIRLLRHPVIKKILENDTQNSVLYFYWGRGSCEMLPFIPAGKFYKTFVRMHGYDLFEYRNNHYIPYRDLLLSSASVVAPSSQAGKDHLDTLYPAYSHKVKVIRCGTVSNNKYSNPSQPGTFNVISCAMLIGLKRIHLQIEALQYINFPIMWYHIGDGILRKELEELLLKLNVADKFRFMGLMDSREILDFYSNNSFDLFVNVSEYEGLPFSIMEAYSAGIPVMATNAGGTGEIVNNDLGKLIPKDITGKDLAGYLEQYYKLSDSEKKDKRSKVIRDYEERWNAINLTNQLAAELKS